MLAFAGILLLGWRSEIVGARLGLEAHAYSIYVNEVIYEHRVEEESISLFQRPHRYRYLGSTCEDVDERIAQSKRSEKKTRMDLLDMLLRYRLTPAIYCIEPHKTEQNQKLTKDENDCHNNCSKEDRASRYCEC